MKYTLIRLLSNKFNSKTSITLLTNGKNTRWITRAALNKWLGVSSGPFQSHHITTTLGEWLSNKAVDFVADLVQDGEGEWEDEDTDLREILELMLMVRRGNNILLTADQDNTNDEEKRKMAKLIAERGKIYTKPLKMRKEMSRYLQRKERRTTEPKTLERIEGLWSTTPNQLTKEHSVNTAKLERYRRTVIR